MILRKRLICAMLTGVCAVAGCDTAPPPPPAISAKAPLASLGSKKTVSPPIVYAFQLIKEEKYKDASRFLNIALQNQPKNPIFHILNAMVYEKLAVTSDDSQLELAAVGYRNALNIEPSNIFAIKQLAMLKAQRKEYGEAQELLANALLMRPKDPDLLHELASASYYAYDIKTALSAIAQAEKLKPQDPLVHRSAAMIHASVGNFPVAKKHFEIFKKQVGEDVGVDHVAARLEDWTSLYQSGRLSPTLADAPGKGGDNALEPKAIANFLLGSDKSNAGVKSKAEEVLESPLGGPGAPTVADPQIIVDCYLLRIQEDASTTKGVNLMSNLYMSLNPGSYLRYFGNAMATAQPGGTALGPTISNLGGVSSQSPAQPAPTAAFAQTSTGVGNFSGNIFTAGLTWSALNYSMNIAQASDERTEVVSRPSLMTFLKKQSVFFSGREFVTGMSGQYGGSLVKYPVGTTMVVTPQKLEDDMVTLTITIEGSIILQSDQGAGTLNLYQSTIQVLKSRIDTQVKMRLGDTLMLGGMYERTEDDLKSGVPGLRDIPVVQYFFSTDKTISSRRSIVVMLTPRSPNIVRAAVERAMQRGPQPCLNELMLRKPDWFNSIPNMVPLFQYISASPVIYHEYRSGDLLPPSWAWQPSIVDKLSELEGFLYF